MTSIKHSIHKIANICDMFIPYILGIKIRNKRKYGSVILVNKKKG